jgi:hypothetical protein
VPIAFELGLPFLLVVGYELHPHAQPPNVPTIFMKSATRFLRAAREGVD